MKDLHKRITELERMCRDYLAHTDTLEAKLAKVESAMNEPDAKVFVRKSILEEALK
jgi:hypothetical protein